MRFIFKKSNIKYSLVHRKKYFSRTSWVKHIYLHFLRQKVFFLLVILGNTDVFYWYIIKFMPMILKCGITTVHPICKLYHLFIPSAKIKTSEPVSTQRISTTLKNNHTGPIKVHDLLHGRLKHKLVGHVIHALLQGYVYTVQSSTSST